MANKFRCITCALLNDGTDGYKVKLRSDEGEVVDGTSAKELTPDEYYSTADIKVIQRTQTPRPNSADGRAEKTNAANANVSDISTESVTGKTVATKQAASKTAAKKTATKKAGKKK